MNRVSIYKAHKIASGGPEVPSVQILISKESPEFSDLEGWNACVRSEAEALDEALSSSLPQGIYDALLVRMLERKRSLFVVPANKVRITYEVIPNE